MTLKTIKDLDVKNKKVIVRIDINAPISANGRLADDTRLIKAIPTIKYLADKDAKVILLAHLGRPEGQVVENLRLESLVGRLSTLLNDHVVYVKEAIGTEAQSKINAMDGGDIILLENIRFYPEEEANDDKFSQQLAGMGDIYVNDAFGTSHREHASTFGITKYLPSYAGLLMEEEIKSLDGVMENHEDPFVAIIGGAKISTKITVIKALLKQVDFLLVGGALASTIVKSRGMNVGKSLVEDDMIPEVNKIDGHYELPTDFIVAKDITAEAQSRIAQYDDIKDDEYILDIGPETIERYAKFIFKAKTVVWNGPMGKYEINQFSGGTNSIARAIAESDARSIIGGGETLEAVAKLGIQNRISFISTGGGAMLKYLEGAKMPAIEALRK